MQVYVQTNAAPGSPDHGLDVGFMSSPSTVLLFSIPDVKRFRQTPLGHWKIGNAICFLVQLRI